MLLIQIIMIHENISMLKSLVFLLKNTFFAKLELIIYLVITIVVLFLIDIRVNRWENSILKRLIINPSKSAKLDIMLTFLYAVNLTPIISILLSFGLVTIIPLYVKKIFGFNLIYLIDSKPIQYLIYVIAYDFLFYWKHRLSHTLDWWWELHKIHHSATELNFITSNRLHPLDEVLNKIFMCLPLAVLGIPVTDYLLLTVIHRTHRMLIHSGLLWDFGFIGKYIIISPIAHKIHHSDMAVHLNKNFGNTTPFWDRLFGTWYEGDLVNDTVGIENNLHNKAVWYLDVWNCYLSFYKTLIASIRYLKV